MTTAPSYFKTYAAADFDLQRPADVAVIMPTIIRPTMKEALQSVFRQAPVRRIQILIGIDRPDGDVGLIEAICAERPAHCCVNVIDPGYSTSVRHGGLHGQCNPLGEIPRAPLAVGRITQLHQQVIAPLQIVFLLGVVERIY